MLCKIHGGWAVSATNDTDGCGLLQGETGKDRAGESDKNPQLGACPYEQGFWVGYQGPEICHGAQTQENDTWDDLPFQSIMVKNLQQLGVSMGIAHQGDKGKVDDKDPKSDREK